MANYDYLKDKYVSTREKEIKENDLGWKHGRGAVYTATDLWNLREMAKHDVYPDGRFSDEECNIWGWFHSFHKEES